MGKLENRCISQMLAYSFKTFYKSATFKFSIHRTHQAALISIISQGITGQSFFVFIYFICIYFSGAWWIICMLNWGRLLMIQKRVVFYGVWIWKKTVSRSQLPKLRYFYIDNLKGTPILSYKHMIHKRVFLGLSILGVGIKPVSFCWLGHSPSLD